ncbi:membrane-associated calcum-binding protein [Cryptosporidium ryanae]|uniref:membrane-associated calcum-binding protein n=1 Tax=Cryptosporidium ryanae TaxID=515981 RepID=UPI00351A526F|nr:membrane-associated calcum-binding protein [Cryptosporidium ryanae]
MFCLKFFGNILFVLVCLTLKHCVSEQQPSNYLRLISDENSYREWLKTITANEDTILERYNSLIDMIDLNKNGMLEESEIKSWVEFITERSTKKESDAEFRLIDKNSDNLISKEEFIGYYIPGEDKMDSQEYSELKRFYLDLFDSVDNDKDGLLNNTEFFKLNNYYSLSGELFKKINSFLAQNDKNGNGMIDKDELEELKKENSEIVSSDESGSSFKIFGTDITGESELTAARLIYLMRVQEMKDAINESYAQIIDVYKTRNNSSPGDKDATSVTTEFAKSNYIIFIQSIIADYGDVFKYPHDIFVGTDNKDYGLTSEECTRIFGENEHEEPVEGEDDFYHDNDEFGDESGLNDDVEISDEMIQRLISLMGNSGFGDFEDGSGNMFDVFANRAQDGMDLGGMDEIIKMLQSLVGSRGDGTGLGSGSGEAGIDNTEDSANLKDEL